jgi:hypothetical protein
MIIRRRPGMNGFLSRQFVAAFLRHPAGLHQVQRCIRGLRGGHVYKDDLERFVRVPMPDEAWMKRFDSVEAEAERVRNQAKRTVAKAIDCVTRMLDA